MAWRLIRNLDHKLFMIAVKEGPGFPVFPGLFFCVPILEKHTFPTIKCNTNCLETWFCGKGRQLEFMGPARRILTM